MHTYKTGEHLGRRRKIVNNNINPSTVPRVFNPFCRNGLFCSDKICTQPKFGILAFDTSLIGQVKKYLAFKIDGRRRIHFFSQEMAKMWGQKVVSSNTLQVVKW
jgi:hypothetical protein